MPVKKTVRMRWLDGIIDSTDMTLSRLWEIVKEDSEGQGRLVCCSSWGHKESDTTETEPQRKL